MENTNYNLTNTNETTWLWPAPYSNKYCSRGYFVKDVNGANDTHKGIDLVNSGGGIYGTPVVASNAGTVVRIFKGCYNHNAIHPWNDSSKWKNCSRARSEEDGSIVNLNGCDYDDVEKYGTVDACNYTLGNGLVIEHECIEDGKEVIRYSQYAHLSELAEGIAVETQVERGQIIGYVGSTGESSGPHLHLSLSKKNDPRGVSIGRYNNNPKNKDSNGNYLVTMGSYHSNACPSTCDSNTCTRDYDYEGGQYYDFDISLIQSPYNLAGGRWATPNFADALEESRYNLIRSRCSADYIRDKNFLVNVGGTAKIRGDVPQRDGYIFTKWECRINGVKTGEYGAGGVINNIPDGATVTLTALWQSQEVKIEHYLDDDTKSTIPDQTEQVNVPFNITSAIPEREGYHFMGWKVNGEGEVKYPGSSLTVTGDTRLVAQWRERMVVIKYDTDGVVDIPDQVIVYTDTENGRIRAPKFEKPGMSCSKWRIKGGDGAVYDADENDLLPGFDNYTLEAAELQRDTYTVTYSFDMGMTPPEGETYDNTHVITTDTKLHGEPYYIQDAIPVQPCGLYFLYWQDEDGNRYAPGERITADAPLDLTAQWVGGCYVLRFDSGVDSTDEFPAYNIPLAVEYPIPRDGNGNIVEGDGITLPAAPYRLGYRFLGWSFVQGNATPARAAGENFTLDMNWLTSFEPMNSYSNALTFVAIWEEQLVSVTMRELYYNQFPLHIRTVKVGDRYGYWYMDGEKHYSAFPQGIDTDEAYFLGWESNGVEITEDSIVENDTDHQLSSHWTEVDPFEDINYDAGSTPGDIKAISWCKHKGLMTGTVVSDGNTYFQPEQNLTRAQVAVILYRMAGEPGWGSNGFYDVPDGEDCWYYTAVSWCKDNGIMDGTDTNVFSPNAHLTRGQLAAVLYRYCGVFAPEKQSVCSVSAECPCTAYGSASCVINGISDSASIPDYFRAAVIWAVGNGILTPLPAEGSEQTEFKSDEPATRLSTAIALRAFHEFIY